MTQPKSHKGINLRTYIPFEFHNENLNTADWSINLALNILVTLLIACRLLRAQRKISSVLPHSEQKSYLGIITILIESAAPITIFGIGVIITSQIQTTMAQRAFTVLGTMLSLSLVRMQHVRCFW